MSNIETREYSAIRLSKDNLKDLAKLHSEVYSSAVAEDYFIKKYDTAYTGVENVGFMAYDRNKHPIAYYGVIPCFIQSGDEAMLAAQSADTMTHPGHRYKGMFVELSNMTFNLCRELNIRLVFGFPNQNSYHGAVNKLGWKMTGTMACFTIPVNSLPLESLSNKVSIFKKLYNQYSHFIFKENLLLLKGISNSVLADGFAGVKRSDDYLSYKSYSTSKVIRVCDSTVWISNKQGLIIGDMAGIDKMNFSAVINKLKKIARKLGVKQMQIHCSPGTSLYKLFDAHYKAAPSYPMLFQDFGSAISPEKVRFTFADIDIF